MSELKAKQPTDDDITYFGKTTFRNRDQIFGIRRDDRRRHMYVLGKTGTGKSTLLENLALSDIKAGEGIAFFDPHGESVEKILDAVPSYRVNDVVYFNPADTEFPIGFNILEIKDRAQKHLVASGLMAVFTKIWSNVWSARMEYILNNTVLALLDTPDQTMLGIARIYTDKKYRNKIVANIKDPVVRNFWEAEYANYSEKYRTEAIAPIQNKVGQFLSSSIIRNIVAQTKSSIDFRDIIDNQKILLVNLSKGRIGEDSSALLGAMMITKLQLAAMSRVDIPESERKDFYLYVDEFQNFATESFATILSEARKYKLNLIVAHQYINQLYDGKTRTAPVRDAIFGNVGSMIIFRTGADDAEFLEKEFEPVFELNDLVNLSKYHVYLKLMINGVASSPFSAQTVPPIHELTQNREKVITGSRERYATQKENIEKKIARWLSVEYFADVGKTAELDDEEETQFEHEEQMGPPNEVQGKKQTPPPQNAGQKQEKQQSDPDQTNSKARTEPQQQKEERDHSFRTFRTQTQNQQNNAPRNKRHERRDKPRNQQHNKQGSPPSQPENTSNKGNEPAQKGQDIWEKVNQIQKQKSSADDVLSKLMDVIDDVELKPSSQPQEKEPAKTEAQKSRPPVEHNKPTRHENKTDNDAPGPIKLKAGEKLKFE